MSMADAYLPSYDYRANNRTTLLYKTSEVYPVMERMIGEAKGSIYLDFFIFSGAEAMKLAQLIKQKHDAGLDVKVLLDRRLGTQVMHGESKPVYEFLAQNGVPVQLHDPKLLPQPKGLKDSAYNYFIHHNKLLVVDGQKALIGSMNLADTAKDYHEFMVQIEGPAAGDLHQQIAFDWTTEKGNMAPAVVRRYQPRPVPPSDGDLATIRVLSNGPGRQITQDAMLDAVSNAKVSIHGHFVELSDPDLVEALIDAHRRGVDVRVALDPARFGHLIEVLANVNEFTSAPAVHRLLEAGVPVRYLDLPDGETAHAKIATIDGVLHIGSTDWTRKAMLFNSETNVEIHGGDAPAEFEQHFEEDWSTLSYTAQDPPWWKRTGAYLYYRLSI